MESETVNKTDSLRERQNIYYSVALQAVIQSQTEAVKTSVTLSSIGMGFLVAIVRGVSDFSCWLTILILANAVAFACNLFAGVIHHLKTADRYEAELKNEGNGENGTHDRVLVERLLNARGAFKISRSIALGSFVIGACLLGFLGLFVVFNGEK